jgi:hypothetical protein
MEVEFQAVSRKLVVKERQAFSQLQWGLSNQSGIIDKQ